MNSEQYNTVSFDSPVSCYVVGVVVVVVVLV